MIGLVACAEINVRNVSARVSASGERSERSRRATASSQGKNAA
ncbi:hypothetical protein [Dictyobacter vulcani]|nr:hypothetical protein [Dictyobacter vulcani]